MKKNNGYKIDFTNNTITMNYTFAAAASNLGTEEYDIIKGIKADFPQMAIIVKKGREPKKARPNKGLKYENMKAHISVYENADELMEMFDKAVKMSKSSKSPYKFVYDWFTMQFPNYADGKSLDKKELKTKPIAPKAVKSVELDIAA